jgi:hypothetical protein
MRQITQGDVSAAARALMLLPEDARPAALVGMIARADLADRFRKARGRVHPTLGNGTLMAAALAQGAVSEPFCTDLAYLHCLRMVIETLILRRAPSSD